MIGMSFLNLRIGSLSRAISPRHIARCGDCQTTFWWVEKHITYSVYGGIFPLCEKCWRDLTVEQRLPHYSDLLALDGVGFDVDECRAVLAAVRSGY